MKNKSIFAIFIIIIVSALAGYFLYQEFLSQKNQVRQDGTSDWETRQSVDYGFEFKYPDGFFDQNQQPQILMGDCNYDVFPDQCPNISSIVAKNLSEQGGSSKAIENNISSPGYWDVDGQKQTINNIQYCLYATGDSATGHAFNYYYYATVKNQKCIVAYFAVTTVNCDFYLPLEPGDTDQKKNYDDCVATNESQPKILDKIISSFRFSK